MSTPVKWLVIFLVGAFAILFVGYTATIQNNDVRTTSEIETLAENMRLGLIRSQIEQSNDGYEYIDKEELAAAIASHVARVQKSHGYNVNLYYVFLDKNGQVTEDEKAIRGIQFIVEYVDENGTVKASAERRLEFNVLNG